MTTKKLLRRQARWAEFLQDLTLLSLIPGVKKMEKQTH